MAEELRHRRKSRAGRSWRVDETYLKVDGRWCCLYRAIDSTGALVDVLFSEHRAMKAARAFFRSAKAVTGVTPDRVTTATTAPLAPSAPSWGNQCGTGLAATRTTDENKTTGIIIKGRTRPMRGFKCPRSAARFCRGYDELHNFLRLRSRHDQHVPADRRRLLLLRRTVTVLALLEAA